MIPRFRPLLSLRLVAAGIVFTLSAGLASAVPWAPGEREGDEFHETPAEKFVENLPASDALLPAPQPKSVPAISRAVRKTNLVNLDWTAIGPFPIPNGQTIGRQDPVSGRATAIAIHPTNENIMYLGTAQGGLYRTLDGGATWTQLMDAATAGPVGTPLAIGAVTIDPTDPTTVIVGTGEGNLSADSYFGSGLYTVTGADGSNPVVNGPFNASAGETGVAAGTDLFTGRSIVAIAVDPTNHNNVFISTSSGVGGIRGTAYSVLPRRGLYRSTNLFSASPTWTRLQITGTTSTNTISTSLVMDPANANNLVVAYYSQAGTDPTGIYRTTNALDPVPTFTQSLALPNFINCKLAIQRATDGTVTVYATADQSSGTLYKSVNGGATFVNKPGANGFAGGQGFYDLSVGVDPNNANNVSVGGQAGQNTFKRSQDGANTFTVDTAGTSITVGLHADVHAIRYAPSNGNVIYHANDGGVWRSGDGGSNWVSKNTAGLSATQFSDLAIHPTDAKFSIGGTQDNGTEQLRADGTFTRVDFGDGGFSLIDQNATDTTNVVQYHTYYNQTANLIGTGRILTNACASEGQWSFHGIYGGAVDPTPYCDGSTDTFNGIALTDATNFYAPQVLGPGNPNTWYFGTDKLYRSINRADTATVASQLLDQTTAGTPPTGTPVSAIAISPQDDNVRLVGLNNGKIFATTIGSPTMLQIAGTGATNGPTNTPAVAVGRIAIDPNNKNVAYFAFGGYGTPAAPLSHVYKVTNLDALSATPPGVLVFTAVSSGLPDVPANALAIDPQSGSNSASSSDIYVGTDLGVYKTTNGGTGWTRYGTSMPRVAVFGLQIQNPNRLIRAATHGRGMYDASIIASSLQAPVLSSVVSRKTHGSAGTFDINMPLTGPAGIEPRKGAQGLNTPGDFTIVCRFTNAISSLQAQVTTGTGTVNSIVYQGNDVIVNLTGVTDVQVLTLTLSNVTDSNGNTLLSASVKLGFNMGDTTGNGVVDVGDAAQTRNNSGIATTISNFRTDVNVDGTINGGDVLIVRQKSGNSIMP